jgi:hypothetical protein
MRTGESTRVSSETGWNSTELDDAEATGRDVAYFHPSGTRRRALKVRSLPTPPRG